jgi:hypothetical protein
VKRENEEKEKEKEKGREGWERRKGKRRGGEKMVGFSFCEYTAGTNKYALHVGSNQVLPMYQCTLYFLSPVSPVMARSRVR